MDMHDYRKAFCIAIVLHLLILAYFSFEKTSSRPVLTAETKNMAGQIQPQPSEQPKPEPIQAVSVDNQELMSAVNHLKEERMRQQQAEQNRQNALKQQAEQARKQRIEEQKNLARLKSEAAKAAAARQKQLEEEKQHLKELAQQKQEQEKRLAEMKQQQVQLKKQQEQEAQKLAELTKKKTAELVKKQQAAAQQAAMEAANTARVAGEVNKYKALILNAISQQWILPQNVDSSMSSQFRIRLAPNGAVLEVALVRSSGDPILDRSAQAAIYKASPLPVPSDPATFNLFRDISLTVRPVSGRG
jgi:colicin import membrane protein